MRYPGEGQTLQIGTKNIKLKGVEYPFIAVSDHWRPALLHNSRLVWIHHYRAIKGLRPAVFKVYYATANVPYNRLPWTVDNESDGNEYTTLEEAINVAMSIAERKLAAVMLGRIGGLATTVKKSAAARENGKLGGRKTKFSLL